MNDQITCAPVTAIPIKGRSGTAKARPLVAILVPLLGGGLLTFLGRSQHHGDASAAIAQHRVVRRHRAAQQPLSFEPVGTAGAVEALGRGARLRYQDGQLRVSLSGDGTALAAGHAREGMRSGTLRMALVGANPHAALELQQPQQDRVTSYFAGSDRRHWQVGKRTYSGAFYRAVYPGVDLLLTGDREQLTYRFIVAPRADPTAIRLAFAGADWVVPGAPGEGLLHVGSHALREAPPNAFQGERDSRLPVAAHVVSGADHLLRFDFAPYDHQQPLVLEQRLTFAPAAEAPDSPAE